MDNRSGGRMRMDPTVLLRPWEIKTILLQMIRVLQPLIQM